jgi:hypothetical protein
MIDLEARVATVARRATITIACLLIAACTSGSPAVTGATGSSNMTPGSTQPAASQRDGGNSTDGCTIATDSEVAQATGLQIAGHANSGAGCTWSVAGAEPGATPFIEYLVDTAEGFQSNKTSSAEAGMNVTDVSAVGDEAYTRGVRGGPAVVDYWVRVGSRAFHINASVAPDVDLATVEQSLAELIAGRI